MQYSMMVLDAMCYSCILSRCATAMTKLVSLHIAVAFVDIRPEKLLLKVYRECMVEMSDEAIVVEDLNKGISGYLDILGYR